MSLSSETHAKYGEVITEILLKICVYIEQALFWENDVGAAEVFWPLAKLLIFHPK